MLEHFEAVRYPHSDVHRAGLMVCSKVSGLEDPVRLHGLTSRSKVPQLDR
jgi:hypothetical protein